MGFGEISSLGSSCLRGGGGKLGGSPFDGRREGGRPGQLERGYTVILATSPLLSGQCLYSFPSSSRGKAPLLRHSISQAGAAKEKRDEEKEEGIFFGTAPPSFWVGLIGGMYVVCIPSLYRVSTGGGGGGEEREAKHEWDQGNFPDGEKRSDRGKAYDA